ncbi:erythroid membrane-associated protein-like [Chiloscyllium plagiosum]|uniref:erythroid membrane-associated protein-like n=1 Tax=Chiloscyllium plagiosum TaxID=36176 RepID=UPI001CB8140C|nr:erythroid membrane-associated protein-like [Chiloscyllium plagiosum]
MQQHSYESCKPLASWIDDLAERVNFFRTWSRQFTATAQKRISSGKTLKLPSKKASELQEIDRPEPYSFWLSAFFFPQGLLTALLQKHARKNSLSVDNVTFEFHVQPFTKLTTEFFSVRKHKSNIWLQAFKHPDPDPDPDPERARTHDPAPPDSGAFLLGLYLDGACWDHGNQVLQDSSVGQRYSEMPEILFLPVQLLLSAVGTKPSLSIRQLSTNSFEYTCQSEGWFPEPDVVWKDSDGRNLLPQSTVARGRGKQQLYDVKVQYQATGDIPSAVTCIIHNSLNNVKEVATGRVNDFLPRAQFRVSEAEWSRIQSYAVPLTLDPDTANPWLVLTESGTSVQDGEARQAGVLDNPERFQVSHCVLASRGFSSGQHYWEVEVGRKEAWDLGLATQSVNRKAKVRGVPNAGHWSLSRLGRTEYQAVDWSPPPQPVELGPELTVVGVYLRYGQGRLSFFDAERRLHLHTFVANFSERVYPFFCPGPYDWQTNAEPLHLPYPTPRERPGESLDMHLFGE